MSELGESIRLKRQVFNKWRLQSREKNLDHYSNEYYLENGIYCIHITKEGKYKFGLECTNRRDAERIVFDNGYYVMSTRTANFTFIDDADVLHFVLNFDLCSGKSLHKELRRRLNVDLFTKDEQTYSRTA